MTTAALSPRPAARPRWLSMARWQTVGHWWVLGGFLLIAVIVISVILALVGRSATPTLSAVQFAPQIGMWMPFGVAIYYCTTWFGPAISGGMTRRSFVRAAVTSVFALAISGALALYVLLRLEPVVYEARGWTPRLDGGRISPADASVPLYLWGLFLLLAVAGLSGLLVGWTYDRLGAWATFLLPLTMLPLIATGVLALDPGAMYSPLTFTRDGDPWRPPSLGLDRGLASVVLGLAILAVTIAAIHLLARRHPVRSARA